MRLCGAIFLLVSLIFLGVGTGLAWHQHHKISTFQPVTATILSTRVECHTSEDSDGHTSTTYKPVIEYRYEVNGRTCTCDQVTPLNESRGGSWASKVVAQYTVGQTCEAYYNPERPGEAFLIRQYTFFPYVFILFPMLFVASGSWVLIAAGASLRKPPEPTPHSGGWYEIKPTSRVVDRRRAALFAAVIYHAVGLAAVGHYFTVAEPPYGPFAVTVTSIYEALGIIPIVVAVRYCLLARHVGDAQALVNAPHFGCGDSLFARVEQAVYSPLHVQQMRIGLVCEETVKTKSGSETTISSHTDYEQYVTQLENHDARPGETLVAEAPLPIPTNKNPTSPPGLKDYPRYTWRIELHTQLADGPDYHAKFPIAVQPAPR